MGDVKREVIKNPGVDEFIEDLDVPLSAAVRCGDLIFVSGQPPIDPKTKTFLKGDIEQQTRLVLENLKRVLEAGGSSLDLVLKTTVYATNSGHFETINRVYREYFPKDPPARTFVPVGSFPYDFDIEIECVAQVKK